MARASPAWPRCRLIARFGPGRICRPLLGDSRQDIENYAREHRLRWVEDPTNMELHFARNFLRAKVLPIIRQQWQGADAAIARSAVHMAEATKLLATLGHGDYARLADGEGVNVAALRALPTARRRNALRAFIARFRGRDAVDRKVVRDRRQPAHGAAGRAACG